MLELLTNMWGYLVGAAAIGLILGWAVRGAFLPRPKAVSVSAKQLPTGTLTEEQKEALAKAEQADVTIQTLQTRLAETEKRLGDVQAQIVEKDELVGSLKDELEDARSNSGSEGGAMGAAVAGVAGAAIGAVAGAVASGGNDEVEVAEFKNDPALTWRNRYLESRVRFLESKMSDATPDAAATAVAAAPVNADVDALKAEVGALQEKAARADALQGDVARLEAELAEAKSAAPVAAAAPAPASEGETDGVDPLQIAKMEWQNKYLRARVSYFEDTYSNQPTAAHTAEDPSTPAVDTDALNAEITALKGELAKAGETDGESEQELARLRWRNRYLEGRLKYLEAASLDAASDADDSVVAEAPQPAAIAEAPVTQAEVIGEPVAEPMPPIEEVRPPAIDAPRDGMADDLKRIGGIGPKIEGILNELGIFHYDQIANWDAGEAAWIDSYLRFQGRIDREKWVDQAASLARAATGE